MSQPKFEATIPLDMVMEVVTEVRSGKLSIETAKKIAWIVGCSLEKVRPSNGPVISGDAEGLDEVFSLLDEMKRTLDQPAFGAAQPAGAIPPAVWALLIELITKFLLK